MHTQSAVVAQNNGSRGRTVRRDGRLGSWIGGWVGGWFDWMRGGEGTSPYASTQFPPGVARLAGTFRESALPDSLYICAPPEMCRAVPTCWVVSCQGLPLYPSAGPTDLLRGFPTEHLTRSRAVSRRPGTFWCGFLSSRVRACPRSCLYANWAGLVLENGKPSPPATYAVRRPPVRHARADSD